MLDKVISFIFLINITIQFMYFVIFVEDQYGIETKFNIDAKLMNTTDYQKEMDTSYLNLFYDDLHHVSIDNMYVLVSYIRLLNINDILIVAPEHLQYGISRKNIKELFNLYVNNTLFVINNDRINIFNIFKYDLHTDYLFRYFEEDMQSINAMIFGNYPWNICKKGNIGLLMIKNIGELRTLINHNFNLTFDYL